MPDIILVDTLEQGLEIAHERYPDAWHAYDIENLMAPFLDNDTNRAGFSLLEKEQYLALRNYIYEDAKLYPETARGISTNNTNLSLNHEVGGYPTAIVNEFAVRGLRMVLAHKGMRVDDSELRKKPTGDQMSYLAKILGLDPELGILFDDQWLKNFGEVANSGGLAIVSPRTIGEVNDDGIVIEHDGVMASRKYEERVLRSLGWNGPSSRLAFRFGAKSNISSIGEVINLRTAA